MSDHWAQKMTELVSSLLREAQRPVDAAVLQRMQIPIAVSDPNATGADMPNTGPRIITETVTKLRELSSVEAKAGRGWMADTLRAIATDLDAGADGRETQEKRSRKRRKAVTRKPAKAKAKR